MSSTIRIQSPSTAATASTYQSFLTTAQAAAILGFHPSYLAKARLTGSGPRYLKIGGRSVRYGAPTSTLGSPTKRASRPSIRGRDMHPKRVGPATRGNAPAGPRSLSVTDGGISKPSYGDRQAIHVDAPALDAGAVAARLGGDVAGRHAVMAPGPGHSRADRSRKIDPSARDGFICHSFAGDNPIACRDHVRALLGLGRWMPMHTRAHSRQHYPSFDNPAGKHTAAALHIWHEALEPRRTIVETYLAMRRLTLHDGVAGDVVRFHPALNFGGAIVGGMVALFRDLYTNEPCGIHRTFLDRDGRPFLDAKGHKVRKMLGRAKHAAIKIDSDCHVTLGLMIGEGFETGLAAQLAGFRPVWALGSAGVIASFPVLSGIEAITILGEIGDGGANDRASRACAARWIEAGREAFIVEPLVGSDLNDVWREVTR
jgi:putative DNA primase/helicase